MSLICKHVRLALRKTPRQAHSLPGHDTIKPQHSHDLLNERTLHPKVRLGPASSQSQACRCRRALTSLKRSSRVSYQALHVLKQLPTLPKPKAHETAACRRPHPQVRLEPARALEQAHALLGREVLQRAVQRAVRHQPAERRLALRAPRRVLVHRPRQDALACAQDRLGASASHTLFRSAFCGSPL